MEVSPLIIFAYNRPTHLQNTIDALRNNHLWDETEVFVYCDGPKDTDGLEQKNQIVEVKKIAESIYGCKSLKIIQSEKNKGLSNSVIDGVTEIINNYGKVIVLEDDMVTSPDFLKFMNEALLKYKEEGKVACISGYVYPLKKRLSEAFFIKGADCWGWATWKDRWIDLNPEPEFLLSELKNRNLELDFTFNNSYPYIKMLLDKIEGKNDSWAILWYASAFLQNKLCLYPPYYLLNNTGNDGSGTHTKSFTSKYLVGLERSSQIKFPSVVKESAEGRKQFEVFFRSVKGPSLFSRILNKLKQVVTS